MKTFNFTGSVVVVTGASGNLGQAVAKAFLEAGATVCALDYRKGRLEKVLSKGNAPGELSLYEEVDVTEVDSLKEVGKHICDSFGKVDILVNTVGGFTMGERVHELSSSTWRKMMNLNVQSFLNTAAVFIPVMIEQGGGKVVSIGSKASLQGGAKSGAYAAAKGALLRLTESMASEMKSHNIQVNCVLPSTIDTPENRQEMPNSDFSKWVSPEHISQVILFLSSAASDEITGAAIPVFGAS